MQLQILTVPPINPASGMCLIKKSHFFIKHLKSGQQMSTLLYYITAKQNPQEVVIKKMCYSQMESGDFFLQYEPFSAGYRMGRIQL